MLSFLPAEMERNLDPDVLLALPDREPVTDVNAGSHCVYQDATQTFAGDRKSNKPNPTARNLRTDKSAWASMGKLLGLSILATGGQRPTVGRKKRFFGSLFRVWPCPTQLHSLCLH